MSEAVVAKRYADALFQIGNEKTTIKQFGEDLLVVKEVFETNESLYTFLKHPRVNNEKKKQFLAEVFQGLHADVVNTLKILVERHRIEITSSIIDHFIQLVNDAKGSAAATVYSVRELSDAERKELEVSFAKRFNKQEIQLENVVDPSLIGGMKIRMGNTIYDGSVSGKLRRIEREIVTANK
ncbi:F0F1 ATP synthase subunit delta [Virgibacillus halodenitrificans]|uniref:ATP synthase subunit delta n=1 Tax=Virgibacillus halodenitrificans TaxID=1482 RepID=A0AAC9J2W8_VIRHA|nr:F0F1 ATP synthase subunit delta [Virgibacillus halodenitrificans]APC49744.1 F0F1 ATP synthase subunit delta [Virgibacillus halodenitrificans]MBD1221476.1 F0F1 ATP synthase subunit delta [Virgibacillus halodenitrificans]MCG1028212.1 F0F1 ATP synthase subunit delta [Virgibacillus halodenitrificans]MYL45450.1 F0F1 ATP synthase subunit delta [Virgibacillus halodenitrificans]WHX26009.1 F0F1 ATP synthase subunit delta [Virgibacillus halodenitrificans]